MERRMVDKIRGITRYSATTLLISLILSILAPTIMHHSSVAGFSTGTHEKEDVFRGSFSQQIFNVAVGQIFEVSFSVDPVRDVSNVVIHLITPGDLVRPIRANEIRVGNVKKGTTVAQIFPMVVEQEVDTYITVKVEEIGVDVPYSSSYEFRVTTPNAPRVQVGPEVEEPPESAGPTSPGTITIKGTLKYYDEGGVLSPVRRIAVFLKDDDTGPDETVASQWTDYSGRFSFTVNNDDGWLQDGRDPYIRIESQNPYAMIRPGIWKIYYWQLPKAGNDVSDGFYYDYGTQILNGGDGRVVCQILNSVLDMALWIWNRVSWTRPQLNVYYPSDGPKFHYGAGLEHIDLPATRHDHATVWHEYGHAVMYELYGDDFPSGSGPDPHNPTSQSSGGFALVEGWAEFMECAIDNNPNNLQWAGHNIETNDWYNHYDSGDMDGNIVEGSVASILWDILDAKNTADKDDMAWGFDEIFHIIRYHDPGSINSFWSRWMEHWPSLSTSKGPLSTIYWHYGIDKDTFGPYGGSVTINGGAAYTRSASVTLTLSCNDYGSGVRYMRIRNTSSGSWSPWENYRTSASWLLYLTGDGTKYIYVQFKDRKGYVSPIYYDTIILDRARPTGSIVISLDKTYTKDTDVTVYVWYNDDTSGVDKVRYQNEGGSWTAWEDPPSGVIHVIYGYLKDWTLLTGDGTKTVNYQIRDKAGWTSTTYSDSIILDTVSPTGSIVINSGNPTYTTSTSVTLYLTYSDATSGVLRVRCSNDGVWDTEPWEAPSATKTWTLPVGDGTKRVYYQIGDYAGWISTYYDDIILDTVNPTGSIVINGGAATTTTTAVTLTLTYSDATSGVYRVRYANLGGSPTAWESPSTTRAWTLLPGVGTKRVYYQIMDNAGRLSAAYYDEITLVTAVADTEIDFTLSPNPASPGDTVLLSGTLMDEYGDPVYPAEVLVEYSTDGGTTWNTAWTLDTNTEGEFSQSFTAPGVGEYLIKISYAGSADYNPSSHTETLIVQEEVWGDYHFRISPFLDVLHLKISGNLIYGVCDNPSYNYHNQPVLGYIEGSSFYLFVDFTKFDDGSPMSFEMAMFVGSVSTLSGNYYKTADGTSWVGPIAFSLVPASSTPTTTGPALDSASSIEPESWPPIYHFQLSPWDDIVRLDIDGSVLHGTDESASHPYHDQPVLGYVSGDFFIFAIDWTKDDDGDPIYFELGIIVGSVSTMSGNAYRTVDGKSIFSGDPTAITLVPVSP